MQARAISFAYRTAMAVQGKQVAYRRGDQVTEPMRALAGRTQDILDTEFGALTKDTKDWIFTTADLVWGDHTAITPAAGDVIQYGADRYEVFDPSGQGCHYYPDPDRRYIRIHTQI
jgi:hypothetical protein